MRRRLILWATICVLGAVVAGLVVGRSSTEAAFPGANGKIAFQTERDGNFEIYSMNPDGSGQTNLTNDPVCCDQAANWSADGTKIAFQRGISSDAYFMNADGSSQMSIKANAFEPAWSPDGSKIAFHRKGIFVMNPDGTGQTKLTSNVNGDQHAAWSPDGSMIAFARDVGPSQEVYVVNADGSGLTNLTNTPGGDSPGSWSPDGSMIAFASDRDGNLEIYVMNADGTGQTRITNNGAADQVPAWSPDGTKIAFTSDRDGNSEIYVMNTDGSSQTRLTNNPAYDGGPDWQPLVTGGNTPTGTNVTVGPGSGVTVTFATVTAAGDTTVTTSTAGPPPPIGFRIVGIAGQPVYYDINTSAGFTGTVTVCIQYDPTQVQGPEASLKLRKFNPPFKDITQSLDTTNAAICGKTSSLSILAVMEPPPPTTPPPPPIGGIGVFPDIGGSSGGSARSLTGVIAAATATVIALGGAAWYARRRWLA